MKILFNSLGSNATGCQRIVYPLQALKEQHGFEYQVIILDELDEQLKWADLVVLQCLVGENNFELIKRCQSKGVKVVVDYDDAMDVLPDILCERIGKRQEEISKNWFKFLKIADMITTPSEMLASYMRTLTVKPVEVLLNFIPMKEYGKSFDYSPWDEGEELRIIYSCSESHIDDFKYIRPVLKWVGERYPQVKILSHGMLDFTYHCPGYKGKAEHIQFTPYFSYYDVLRHHKPHIFIAPLRFTPHNVYRSSLKYLQAGLLKCAFIGSNLPPYNCVSPSTGILTNSRLGWWWHLRKLIKDKNKTQKLGERAYSDVNFYLLEENVLKWKRTYEKLIKDVR